MRLRVWFGIALLCIIWPNLLLADLAFHSLGPSGCVALVALGVAGATFSLIFSGKPIVLWLINLPAVLIAPIFAGFVWAYREPPQNGVWVSLLSTDSKEATEQLSANLPFVIAGIFAITLYGLACREFYRGHSWIPLRSRLRILGVALLAVLLLNGVAIPWTYPNLQYFRPLSREMVFGSFPTGAIVVATEVVLRSPAQITPVPQRIRVTERVDREIYVFLVGETVQFPRWLAVAKDIHSPLLSSPDNILFEQNYSQADFTSWSVPLMLTGDALLSEAHPTWPEFAKAAGCSTAWLSTSTFESDPTYEAQVERVSDLQRNGKHTGDLYDDELLKPLDDELARPDRKICIVMHTMGGHLSYIDRYRPGEAKYPVDESKYLNVMSSGHADAIHAAYANAMLKDIHFVEKIEDRLRGQKGAYAFLVYAPDHGENLFDDHTSVLTHGREHPSKYELQVPLIIWGSERMREANAQGWSNMQSKVQSRTSNRSIFPTLLWAMGVQGTFSDTPSLADARKESAADQYVAFGFTRTEHLDDVLNETPDASLAWRGQIAGAANP